MSKINNIIETDNLVACFVNTLQEPVKEKHICYNVKVHNSDMTKMEVEEIYEAFYPHPEAPEGMIISIIRVRRIGMFPLNSFVNRESPAAQLFLNAQMNLANILNKK